MNTKKYHGKISRDINKIKLAKKIRFQFAEIA